MILQEIDLGETKESRRKAIQQYFGRDVILKSCHTPWYQGIPEGVILIKGHDKVEPVYDIGGYRIILSNSGDEKKLLYHDLEKLLVIPINTSPKP